MSEPSTPSRVLASDWYAAMLADPDLVSVSAELEQRFPAPLVRLATHLRPVRGLLIALAARTARGLALTKGDRGTMTALALEALVGRRRTVLLEFIGRPAYGTAWKRALYRLWTRVVERPAIRRAVVTAQVLTAPEAALYAREYAAPASLFRYVPWAYCRTGEHLVHSAADRGGVVSSGRAFCDWDGLFAAARGRDWGLTVVSGVDDASRLRALDDGAIRILSEIPRSEHDRLVREAAVFVICLDDPGVSAGQVRLMTAIELGTPVVATDGAALEGYLEDGLNAIVVPPGDPEALGNAVDGLLADPAVRDRLAASALERARRRTYPDYFDDVRKLVRDSLPST